MIYPEEYLLNTCKYDIPHLNSIIEDKIHDSKIFTIKSQQTVQKIKKKYFFHCFARKSFY